MHLKNKIKPLPISIILFWILLNIAYSIISDNNKPPTSLVLTPRYLLLTQIIPAALTFGIILYSYLCPSSRRFSKTLILILAILIFGFNIVSYFDFVDRTRMDVFMKMNDYSITESILKINLPSFFYELMFFLIGFSFINKTPYYFEYPSLNRIQKIMLICIGIFLILFSVHHFLGNALLLKTKSQGEIINFKNFN